MKYNNKVINCYNIPLFHVHSDASNTGIACVFDVRGKKNICYRNLTELEKTFSSTWRELEAIRFSLLSGIKQFENKCIFWYTANFATQQIIKRGSNKTHIHLLALNIFNLTFHHNIHLEVFWVGREYNKEADKISKTIDFDDWYMTQHLINILEQRWGKISIDRFPSDINRKSKRFNSRYLCPETEGINAFSIDWSKEANLLVPPTYLIPRAIKHFLKSLTKSEAILIYPYWPSAPFWSLLASGQDTYFSFVKDVYLIENPAACIKLGDNKKINFRFTRLPRLFYCNFNDKITTKKKTKKETKKRKEHYLVTVDAISQGLQKIFPQVNKNLIDLFEFLPHVLANSRENNTNKSYMNYFIKWQKWTNQFPEVDATPAEEIYVILYMLSLFQNNKSYPVIRMSYYAIKYFNEFFTGGRELRSHFITKVLERVKRLSGYTENPKSPLSNSDLKRAFQYLGGVEMNLTNSRLMMILVLSFMGFLRFSELSNLKRSDFILHNTHMSIFIEKSKTDIYRKGH